jgi:hypothetical protein
VSEKAAPPLLALARSLRARLVVASDCEDLRIIRLLAQQLGVTHLANEQVVSLLPLREVSNWTRTENLEESLREILPPKLPTVLLLQGGYRPQALNSTIIQDLAPTVTVIILPRAELENHLLEADTIARALRCSAGGGSTAHIGDLHTITRNNPCNICFVLDRGGESGPGE